MLVLRITPPSTPTIISRRQHYYRDGVQALWRTGQTSQGQEEVILGAERGGLLWNLQADADICTGLKQMLPYCTFPSTTPRYCVHQRTDSHLNYTGAASLK